MEIKFLIRGKNSQLLAVDDDILIGEMLFAVADAGALEINHTEVDPCSKGKGIGTRLVHAAVEYARGNKLKIIPNCPFVKSVMSKNTDYHDIWQPAV